jgi:hypothetical protein
VPENPLPCRCTYGGIGSAPPNFTRTYATWREKTKSGERLADGLLNAENGFRIEWRIDLPLPPERGVQQWRLITNIKRLRANGTLGDHY